MLAFILRRLLVTVPLLAATTAVTFFGTSYAVDPLANLSTCTTCDNTAYDRIVERYDLDRPVVSRYFTWMGRATSGDLGRAESLGGQGVGAVIVDRAGNTLLLAVPAWLLSTVFATLLGLYTGRNRGKLSDYVVTLATVVVLALPVFFIGLFLQLGFAIWLPDALGVKPFWSSGLRSDGVSDLFSSITLPVASLALVITASDSRIMRSAVIEAKNADHVLVAQAYGLKASVVSAKHIVRNVVPTAVSLWSVNAAALLGGSLVVETVFAWPGLGRLLIDALSANDLDLLMATVLLVTVLVVISNLIADLVEEALDPKVRNG